MPEGCRNLRRYKDMSGFEPARFAPGKLASGLILSLALAFALPAAGEAGEEEAAAEAAKVESERESQAKEVRPALARRKRNALNQFDPKVFEARGRELQGEYYEITTIAKGSPSWSAAPTEAEVATTAPGTSSSKNWMIWSGAAGLAALVGGAAGY